jgi:ABC-type multidrug transport system fused ATPase/permease subunit
MVRCDDCGHEVPEGNFCIRCGNSLSEELARKTRRGFAANPREGLNRPSVVSSIFPQLPRADMDTFRVALLLGVVVVVVLAVFRLFPLAVVASAFLTPLLVVLYLYDVDVYEDEPISVIAFTMLWGIAAGVVAGFIAKGFASSGAAFLEKSSASTGLLLGVVMPVISVALMIAGPLLLLPRKSFNDVLDGATFGGASAVCFAGAQLVTSSFTFLANAGLRPVGSVTPWIIRVLELAVAAPILAAAVIGATGAAFWLRYRSPVRDRDALGVLGQPFVALVVAAAVLIVAALGQLYLSDFLSLILYVVLDAVTLVWLRRVLHLGLREEAAEIETGPDIQCANCGATTPRHSFCINCGVSLLALPNARRADRREAPPEAGGDA